MSILRCIPGVILAPVCFFLPPACAQILPDNSLSTTVSVNGQQFTINGGTTAGQNLFHSFSQFSIPTGSSASFNNDPTVTNIFSRVTGRQISNIDGLIQTQGSANLFLLNPNGILFGPNAQLQLGGSFLATTATSLTFHDGQTFSATGPPLLSISVPTSLQMLATSGPIVLKNQGHNLIEGNEIPGVAGSFQPTALTPIGLQVNPGQSLTLVGQGISLDGAVLKADRLTLASASSSNVQLSNPIDLDNASPITLSNQSLVQGRNVQLQGSDILFRQGSMALVQNNKPIAGEGITVNATESLMLQDANTALVSNTLQGANAGNIRVTTKRLSLLDAGSILSRTFSFRGSKGGDVAIVATERMELSGVSAVNDDVSIISSSSFGFGPAGNLSATTGDLLLRDGGSISSTSFVKGPGGSLQINAENIDIRGFQPIFFRPSNFAASTFSRGAAGDVTVNTGRLTVADSGLIDSSSYNNGNAGSVRINARGSVTIDGQNALPFLPSRIASAAGPLQPEVLRRTFRQPDQPMGAAGDLVINTPNLQILNGGLITVQNTGNGNAGTLEIHADQIRLSNGQIIAATQVGNGGNLDIQAQSLRLLNGSTIAANAGGEGNGGNIKLRSQFLVGLGNSDIIASADRGQGGDIAISAIGVYGLNPAQQPTSNNDITASSNLGLDGTISITGLDLDLNAGLVQLPTSPMDPNQVQGCNAYSSSRFVATGRSGLPDSPMDRLQPNQPWTDLRPGEHLIAAVPPEAQSWRTNTQGEIQLLASCASR